MSSEHGLVTANTILIRRPGALRGGRQLPRGHGQHRGGRRAEPHQARLQVETVHRRRYNQGLNYPLK